MPPSTIEQTVTGNRNIFTATGDIHVVNNVSPLEAEDRHDLLILLESVKKTWIEGLLRNSLHSKALLSLDKTTQPKAVEHPWGRMLELPNETSQSIPSGNKIVDVFNTAGRSLLILGEPGSGKTTTLLELAQQLIEHCENDAVQSIPVIFNLSTWTRKLRFVNWVIGELSAKYRVPARQSEPWLKRNRLLFLLDGLDEVRIDDRNACVEAINEFAKDFGLPGLVVCSRRKEYTALSVRLRVNAAICLQPLTPEQINLYLAEGGPKLSALHKLISVDPILQRLAESPLMLSLMSLAYQDLSIDSSSGKRSNTIEAGRKQLFDNYLESMVRTRGKPNQPYTDQQVIVWLSWLAQQMSYQSQSIFLIEQLQPSWLVTHEQQAAFDLISHTVLCLLVLLPGLIGWPLGDVYTGLKVGFGFGAIWLLLRSLKTNIETVENLRWSWSRAAVFALGGMFVGTITQFRFTIMSLILTLIGLTLGGVKTQIVKAKSYPNQGIKLSIRNAIFSGLIFGLSMGLSIGLWVWGWLNKGRVEGLREGLIFGLILGWLVGLWYGGVDAIQHYVLRYYLYRKGFPRSFINFLDYAVHLTFLQKVGGGYIFIHRFLLEYFAALNKPQA